MMKVRNLGRKSLEEVQENWPNWGCRARRMSWGREGSNGICEIGS